MHDRELLDLWGCVGQATGVDRTRLLAARLAHVADPDTTSVGDVNRALLRAYRDEVGDRLECVATCPFCGDRLETDASAGEILAAAVAHPAGAAVRAPTLADFEAAAAEASVEAAKRELLRRCGHAGSADADAVSAALEAADPCVAVRLSLRCPACETVFTAVVDVAAHLWAALDRRARALVADVAELAVAYGWTEDEVLRLPPVRRRAYAERAAR
jgi:hypothetical protein